MVQIPAEKIYIIAGGIIILILLAYLIYWFIGHSVKHEVLRIFKKFDRAKQKINLKQETPPPPQIDMRQENMENMPSLNEDDSYIDPVAANSI